MADKPPSFILPKAGHDLVSNLAKVLKGDHRSVLNSVAFGPDFVVGTDSRFLATIPWEWVCMDPPKLDRLYVVPSSALVQALGRRTVGAEVTLGKREVQVRAHGITSTFAYTEGNYPNVRKLLDERPKESDKKLVGVSAQLLSRIQRVFADNFVTIVPHGETQPADILADERHVGIFMPVRIQFPEESLEVEDVAA